MSYISNTPDFSKVIKVEVGDVTITPEVVTQSVQVEHTEPNTNKDVVLPAGAYYASIRPLSFGAGGTIIVNNEPFILGKEFNRDSKYNEATKTLDLVPAITIVANGNPYIITISYPSDSGITEAQLQGYF